MFRCKMLAFIRVPRSLAYLYSRRTIYSLSLRKMDGIHVRNGKQFWVSDSPPPFEGSVTYAFVLHFFSSFFGKPTCDLYVYVNGWHFFGFQLGTLSYNLSSYTGCFSTYIYTHIEILPTSVKIIQWRTKQVEKGALFRLFRKSATPKIWPISENQKNSSYTNPLAF